MEVQDESLNSNQHLDYQLRSQVATVELEGIDGEAIQQMTLNEVFEHYVDRNPTGPAIITSEEYITYGELEVSANRVAHLLRSRGIGRGDFVGVYFNRSEKPIVSILGILKAGATYVPLDPSYPKDRLSYILTHTEAKAVLTQSDLASNIDPELPLEVMLFNDCSFLDGASSKRIENNETGLINSDLSYILFTSGTTGEPKGIMAEHRNVAQFSHSFNKVCELTHRDRVYQGFALVFDGSVEEMWMAFGSGATLVIGKQEFSKLADESAKFMNKMRVTVFSTVPTFLSLVKENLRTNRLIIVSGEPCPPALVNEWANDQRRMLNVYGPTETTVNTTVKECHPNEEVTIGKPLEGYQTYILDKELRPVGDGEEGELYIGGVGVARGYFKLKEQTEKSYIQNPFNSSERLYKTGDLVKMMGEEIHFIRRMDNQVKIRGFRIELSEINSLLEKSEQIALAVTKVVTHRGQKKIACYVTLKESESLQRSTLLKYLKGHLPPYMVPSFLDVVDEFPRLPSGKIDQKNLAEPVCPLVDSDREIVLPQNIYEANLLSSWQKILKNDQISIHDDFFSTLGGDSLAAVEMLVDLRERFGYEISVRDVYNELTIEKIAKKAVESGQSELKKKEDSKKSTAQQVFEQTPRWERYFTAILQLLTLIFFYASASVIVIAFVAMGVGVAKGTFSVQTAVWITSALTLLGFPFNLLLSVALKWIIIGRYKAGRYPLWGFYYFRCWLAAKIQGASGIGLFAGTPVVNLYYRMLGMKIGKGTIIDTNKFFAVDLVSIGADCSIGSDSDLSGHLVVNGEMVLGKITVEDRCYIGNHSYVGLGSVMEEGSRLDDLSALEMETVAKKNCGYKGSPATKAYVDLSAFNEQNETNRHPVLMSIGHFVALSFVGVLFTLIGLPSLLSLLGAYFYAGVPAVVGTMVFWSLFGTLFFCLMVAAIKFVLMRQTVPGVYSTHSFYYLRKWVMDLFMALSNKAVHSLYTTIYLPSWLRLLGAKIGKMAEISTVTKMTPDLTEIGQESFFADGSMIGGRRFYNGQVQYAYNKIGKRSFVGNNAMLPLAESLGDNCLLGVLSTPPKSEQMCTPDNSEWLGSPSFHLPHRNKVTIFSDVEMFSPTKKLIAQRLIIDGLRILIPNFIALSSSLTYILFLYYGFTQLTILNTLLFAPLVSFGLVMISALSVVLLKKGLMGTFKPVKKPLWSTYVWFNELVNGVYETVGAPLMAPFMGTPFYNWYLRLMGCKIGKHCYIGTSLFSEFDLVNVGDYCALNSGVIIQNHLFEDRVMKSSNLYVENNCTVGSMSVVLYDSRIEENSEVAPLSLVMKGDHLPKNSNWSGIPVNRVN